MDPVLKNEEEEQSSISVIFEKEETKTLSGVIA